MSEIITNRYEFVLLFDVIDGNPNGDPDAGNIPRVDPETGIGIVTDVCLKRKVRNYIQIKNALERPYDIYIKEKAVLGRSHVEAFKELGYKVGEEKRIEIPNELQEEISEVDFPEGLSIEDDDEKMFLVSASDLDKKIIKEYLKEIKLEKSLTKFIELAIKDVKARKPTATETKKGGEWMCSQYYDIRTFGAVLALKSAPNCGQIKGPVQLTFAHSIDPVFTREHSITRVAVATEYEAMKQNGRNQTMGRKSTVPYGLYISHGFISAHLAERTGFNDRDLQLLWEALINMFDHDHSAARGMMNTRKLIVFKHNTALGNAPAHQLFDAV
ncbi:MAG: type I-C CRISPR-associated protein Cas7/Csd2, partial [Clostridiales bacterium]